MIWTRRLMRTALVFSIMMTILTNESDAEYPRRVDSTDCRAAHGARERVLETDGRRLYAAAGIRAESGRIHLPPMTVTPGVQAKLNHSVYCNCNPSKYSCMQEHIRNGVVRSDNLGETWKPINDGLPLYEELDQYGRVEQILVTSSGTVITVTCFGYVYIDRPR